LFSAGLNLDPRLYVHELWPTGCGQAEIGAVCEICAAADRNSDGPHYRLGDFAKIVNRSGFAGSASVLDFTEFNDRSGEDR
jgi:hypothetical protein